MEHTHRRTISEKSIGIVSVTDTIVGDGWNDGGKTEGEKARGSVIQVALIYLLYISEVCMAGTVWGHVNALSANDAFRGSVSSRLLFDTLECPFAFGAALGLVWGWLSDRLGRRPVALIGLAGMAMSCIGVSMASSAVLCAWLRFASGFFSSSTAVVTFAMISDLSPSTSDRAIRISRLPLMSFVGSLLSNIPGLVSFCIQPFRPLWSEQPLLWSQLTCGAMMLIIFAVMFFLLEESLPRIDCPEKSGASIDSDGSPLASDHEDSPLIAATESSAAGVIPLRQIIFAPSLLILLLSLSVLILHTSTFHNLLQHLGQTPQSNGGVPAMVSTFFCTSMINNLVCRILVCFLAPYLVRRAGSLRPYRLVSCVFPVLYIITPILAYSLASSRTALLVADLIAISLKTLLLHLAFILAVLLLLNASPDAFTTGTIAGLLQFSYLFRAVARLIVDLSFYFGAHAHVVRTNTWLWAFAVGISLIGAILNWSVRDHAAVNQDFPAAVLKWVMYFDARNEPEVGTGEDGAEVDPADSKA